LGTRRLIVGTARFSNANSSESADAHSSDGKRFIVHADEKLIAFLELQAAIHRQPASYKTPTAKSPDAQLSARALHLPTPRATG